MIWTWRFHWRCPGSIPGQGTKILKPVWCRKKKQTLLFWFKVEQRQAPFPLDPYTVSQILEKQVFTSLPRRLETLHVCQSTGLTHSILQHYLLFLEYILIISTKIRPTFNSFAQIPSLNDCLKWPLPSWALQHVMLLGGLCDLDHSLVCVVTFQKTWSTKLES